MTRGREDDNFSRFTSYGMLFRDGRGNVGQVRGGGGGLEVTASARFGKARKG